MIKFQYILSAVAFVLLLGTGCGRHERTVLPRTGSKAALNALANHPSASRADRARAIFALFAHHIRPGSTAAEVHRVLTDTHWLQQSNLYGIYFLAGFVPVEPTSETTVFELTLFPQPTTFSDNTQRPWSPWVIYFSLSNNQAGGGLRHEAEASAFLRGDPTIPGNPKLTEFALCFPNPDAPDSPHQLRGRIERFSARGLQVYEAR